MKAGCGFWHLVLSYKLPFLPGFELTSCLKNRGKQVCLLPALEKPLMSWYAYCLTDQRNLTNGTRTRRPFVLEGIQDVHGATVLSYPSGEFAVILSEFDPTKAALDDERGLE